MTQWSPSRGLSDVRQLEHSWKKRQLSTGISSCSEKPNSGQVSVVVVSNATPYHPFTESTGFFLSGKSLVAPTRDVAARPKLDQSLQLRAVNDLDSPATNLDGAVVSEPVQGRGKAFP